MARGRVMGQKGAVQGGWVSEGGRVREVTSWGGNRGNEWWWGGTVSLWQWWGGNVATVTRVYPVNGPIQPYCP